MYVCDNFGLFIAEFVFVEEFILALWPFDIFKVGAIKEGNGLKQDKQAESHKQQLKQEVDAEAVVAIGAQKLDVELKCAGFDQDFFNVFGRIRGRKLRCH